MNMKRQYTIDKIELILVEICVPSNFNPFSLLRFFFRAIFLLLILGSLLFHKSWSSSEVKVQWNASKENWNWNCCIYSLNFPHNFSFLCVNERIHKTEKILFLVYRKFLLNVFGINEIWWTRTRREKSNYMLNKRQKRKGEDEKNKKMNILEKKHNWVDYQILPCHRAAEPFHQ